MHNINLPAERCAERRGYLSVAGVLCRSQYFFDALTGAHHQYSCDSDHVM